MGTTRKNTSEQRRREGYARYMRLADDVEMRERMTTLDAYFRDRAEIEGADYDLKPRYFLAWFADGMRTFFGVDLDVDGRMVRDRDEPLPGFFESWLGAGCPTH